MSERNYRDPVHNIVNLRTNGSEGQLLADLIDSAEFQRLRRIRQLGLAHFAYQGAEHSRFTHSIGAFHLATRILNRLQENYKIALEDRTAVRCAALLHDIGHGPFSHVVESILGFHHESFTIEAMRSTDTEIGSILSRYSEELPDRVAAIIDGSFRPMALAQLVSSQLDVDRMDYLLRDSLMTGVKYGVFDLEWVIKSLEIDETSDRLYVSAPGIYAVEDYLQSRYYMFRQVYFHRTLRSAEVVLRSLLRRAITLFRSGQPIWYPAGSAIERVLSGEPLSLNDHLSLDDADLSFCIKHWRRSSDAVLSDLCSRFLDRRLFRAFDLDMPEDARKRFISDVRSAVVRGGFDPEYYFLEDNAGDVEHYFYSRNLSDPKDMILVEDGYSRPRLVEISEISSSVRGLQKGLKIHRICFPTEVKVDIAAIYHA